jgi:peptide/nickel transport system permease protein
MLSVRKRREVAVEAPQRRRRLGPVGVAMAALLAAIGLLCAFGPFFLPDPDEQDLLQAGLGLGSPGHLLGTDSLGRDLLARAVVGGRVSILIGLGSVLIGLVVGGGLGIIAGYFRGRTEAAIMMLMDVLLAFPSLVLALTISAFLGASMTNLVFAIGVVAIPEYARLARASALTWGQRDFVLSSRLMGNSHRDVVLRHVVPNVAQPILAYGFLVMAKAIIAEASLSFLGLGLKPPQSSWGVMISTGRSYLLERPMEVVAPGLLIFLTIVSLNLLGDVVREQTRDSGGPR